MASETTTTALGDSTLTAWVTSAVLDEARPYNVSRPLLRYAGAQKSNAYNFPVWGDAGVAAAYTEGTDLGNTIMSDTAPSAAAGIFGQAATVTDEAEETTVYSAVAQTAATLGRATAEKFETDACALYDDFTASSNTSNTAGVPLTYITCLGAVNGLEQRDMVGTPVFVLDPAQVGQVRQDVGSSGAALFGNPAMPVNGVEAATLSGYAGFAISGAPVYQTSLVTATGGACFLAGVAIGHYEIRAPRSESIRVPALPGITLVNTTRYGLVEIRDAAGQTIYI